MKTLIIFLIVLSGCRTIPPQMVNMRFKPTKAGVVKIGDDRSEAAKLMKLFCEPQRAEVVEISSKGTAIGSTTTIAPRTVLTPATAYTNTRFENADYASFQCVDADVADTGN